LYAFLMTPMNVTCLAKLILLDFIILIISGQDYTNYEAPHTPVIFSLLGPNIFLSILSLNTLNLCFTSVQNMR
jgi:hypothetical protein